MKWAETVQTSTTRDKALQKIGKVFQQNKQVLKEKEAEHKDAIENLNRCKEDNKQKEYENQALERQI